MAIIVQSNACTVVGDSNDAEPTLTLHAEKVAVSRRLKPTAIVRASTTTRARDHHVNEELTREQVIVEHVAIGRMIDVAPDVRIEGDTTIISIVEEVLVLEKRLILKEEVRMTKVRTTAPHTQTITLREQDVVVTRIPLD